MTSTVTEAAGLAAASEDDEAVLNDPAVGGGSGGDEGIPPVAVDEALAATTRFMLKT